MKVRFLHEGGFNRAGAFVELDEDQELDEQTNEFEIQRYLTLDLQCNDVKYGSRFEVKSDKKNEENTEDEEKVKRGYSRSIAATGNIQRGRWGQFQLSILGNTRKHSTIDVSLIELEEYELVRAGGIGEMNDLDLDIDERFYISIYLVKERFEKILKELSYPGAQLKVRFDIGRFPNFFATWSPSIDEGRVIKFLGNSRDVENEDEVPKEFWQRARRKKPSDDDDLDFEFDRAEADVDVTVVRPIGNEGLLPSQSEPEDLEEEGDLFGVDHSPHQAIPQQPGVVINLDSLVREVAGVKRKLGLLVLILVVMGIVWSFTI